MSPLLTSRQRLHNCSGRLLVAAQSFTSHPCAADPVIVSEAVLDSEVPKEDSIVLDCDADMVRDLTYTWLFNGGQWPRQV